MPGQPPPPPHTMVWLLFRALCCLCSNRQNYQHYYDDDADESEDDDDDDDDGVTDWNNTRYSLAKVGRMKRAAIAATTDLVKAEQLLKTNTNDSGLLMYYDQCAEETDLSLARLPVYGTRVSDRITRYRVV